MPFWKKKAAKPEYPYDPETERPVIRASICTGEQVAGFKNKTTGAFREIMLIRSERYRHSGLQFRIIMVFSS